MIIKKKQNKSSWSSVLVIIIAHQFYKQSVGQDIVKLGFDDLKYDNLDDFRVVLIRNSCAIYSFLNWHLSESHIHKRD